MLKAYSIILEPAKECGFIVFIPDFDISTQGKDYADAMFMARDAICCCMFEMIENNKEIPEPTDFLSVPIDESNGQIKTLVDVNFKKYLREHDTRSVKKNCTIPAWLNEEAMEQKINFSQVLQEGLKSRLGL